MTFSKSKNFWEITACLSLKSTNQLLLDGFRYRRDRLVWRCIKEGCKDRARYHENSFKMYRDHICQAPNTDEIEKAVFHYEIRKKAEQSHHPPRLRIEEARLKLSEDAAMTIPQYSPSIRVVQCARRDKNIPPAPKTFADLITLTSFTKYCYESKIFIV